MSAGPLPMVALARPVVQETDCWDEGLVVPLDNTPLFTLLLPLSGLLLAYLGLLAYSVFTSSPSLLLDGLRLGRSEEDVERLPEADGQANQSHQGHIQSAGLDLLKVLPVHVAPLGSLFEGPIGGMTQSSDPSTQSSLLLLEAGRGSVGLGRSLGLDGGHTARPSGFPLARDTSHVTSFGLTSLVPSQIIEHWRSWERCSERGRA